MQPESGPEIEILQTTLSVTSSRQPEPPFFESFYSGQSVTGKNVVKHTFIRKLPEIWQVSAKLDRGWTSSNIDWGQPDLNGSPINIDLAVKPLFFDVLMQSASVTVASQIGLFLVYSLLNKERNYKVHSTGINEVYLRYTLSRKLQCQKVYVRFQKPA